MRSVYICIGISPILRKWDYITILWIDWINIDGLDIQAEELGIQHTVHRLTQGKKLHGR